MSNDKHTPGPWNWSIDTGENIIIWKEDKGPNDPAIAYMSHGEIWEKEQEANARLIAAAPDMLAMLERDVEMMREVCLCDECGGCAERWKTERLIAKAKGETA